MALLSPFRKLWIVIILFIVTSIGVNAQDSTASGNFYTRFFKPDKGKHLIGSFMVTVASAKLADRFFDMPVSKSRNAGAILAFSIGFGKELQDQTKADNRFSWQDLAADIGGIALGLLVLEIK